MKELHIDPNKQDEYGKTALHKLAHKYLYTSYYTEEKERDLFKKDVFECARYLLGDGGADPFIQDKKGNTFLHPLVNKTGLYVDIRESYEALYWLIDNEIISHVIKEYGRKIYEIKNNDGLNFIDAFDAFLRKLPVRDKQRAVYKQAEDFIMRLQQGYKDPNTFIDNAIKNSDPRYLGEVLSLCVEVPEGILEAATDKHKQYRQERVQQENERFKKLRAEANPSFLGVIISTFSKGNSQDKEEIEAVKKAQGDVIKKSGEVIEIIKAEIARREGHEKVEEKQAPVASLRRRLIRGAETTDRSGKELAQSLKRLVISSTPLGSDDTSPSRRSGGIGGRI